MKKLLLVFIMILCLTSCKSFDHIEDENGADDYSLVQLVEEDIINKNSGVALISIISNTSDGGNASIEKFSGVKKFAEIKNKNKIIVSFDLSSGNARLCIVSKTRILHTFNINEENQEYIINTNEKIYLKLAGESAKVNIKYSFE